MVLNVHKNHKAYLGRGEGGGYGGGECFIIVRDKDTRQCPQTTFLKRKEAEADSNRGPPAYQPNTLPLGQTPHVLFFCCFFFFPDKRRHAIIKGERNRGRKVSRFGLAVRR